MLEKTFLDSVSDEMWIKFLNEEKEKNYFEKLSKFLNNEYLAKTILPEYKNIFNAFKLTDFNNIKIIIIGQDPYPTKGVANGLAFSVNKNQAIPKSLVNIFKEICCEFDFEYPVSGDLTSWASHGIFLINRILTVEEGKPLSHKNKGWEQFTTNAIKFIEKNSNGKIVYLLFGNEAKKIKEFITNNNHFVLETSHPSPLGAYKGFIGSGIFKKACELLDISKETWRL